MTFQEAMAIIKEYDVAVESGDEAVTEFLLGKVQSALKTLSELTGISEGDLAEDASLTSYASAEDLIQEYKEWGIV